MRRTPARRSDRIDARRLGPDRIVQHEGTDQHALHADVHAGRPLEVHPAAHVTGPGRERRPRRLANSAVPTWTSSAVHPAGDPGPRHLLGRLGQDEGHAALAGAGDDRRRQDVGRDLLERRGEAQHLFGRAVRRRCDVGEVRPAGGERAGLVEQQDACPRDGLERTAALDDDPALRRAADAGHDRDRGGQEQRAGRRHDQHGERAHRVARGRPRRSPR